MLACSRKGQCAICMQSNKLEEEASVYGTVLRSGDLAIILGMRHEEVCLENASELLSLEPGRSSISSCTIIVMLCFFPTQPAHTKAAVALFILDCLKTNMYFTTQTIFHVMCLGAFARGNKHLQQTIIQNSNSQQGYVYTDKSKIFY